MLLLIVQAVLTNVLVSNKNNNETGRTCGVWRGVGSAAMHHCSHHSSNCCHQTTAPQPHPQPSPHPTFIHFKIRSFQFAPPPPTKSHLSAGALPITITEHRPRVNPTFIRLSSATNPIAPLAPVLTAENMTTSFSLPWYPSMVLTSSSDADGPRSRDRQSRKWRTWAR